MENVATQLQQRGAEVDEVLHSGLLRATESATILGSTLCPSCEPLIQPGLRPNDDPISLAIEVIARGRSSLLVGHLPFMHLLSGFLISGKLERGGIEFLTGTVACFEKDGTRWSLTWRVDPEI